MPRQPKPFARLALLGVIVLMVLGGYLASRHSPPSDIIVIRNSTTKGVRTCVTPIDDKGDVAGATVCGDLFRVMKGGN